MLNKSKEILKLKNYNNYKQDSMDRLENILHTAEERFNKLTVTIKHPEWCIEMQKKYKKL